MSETVTLEPGELPPPACYATEQERFNAYVAAIIATITGDNEVHIGPDAPSDTSLLWVKTNGPTGAPIAILTYSADDASWVRVTEIPTWGGITAGAGASYQIVNDPPYLTDDAAYVVGKTYWAIANHDSVGPSTWQTDSLSVKNIKKNGSEDLEAGSIANNQVFSVTYDGVNMQLNSPNLTTAEITIIIDSILDSLSYETDSGSYQPIPAFGDTAPFPHGLMVSGSPVVPKDFDGRIVCVTDDAQTGYLAGDELKTNSSWDTDDTGRRGWQIWANDTNVNIIRLVQGSDTGLWLPVKSTGVLVKVTTEANFKLKAYATLT